MPVAMSDEMKRYFESIDAEVEKLYEIARKARAKGIDPSIEPEVNVASDIAGRVEELVGPPGIAEKIRELSKTMNRDRVAFRIAEMIVDENRDKGLERAADLAIRCALAIKTEGVVSAPLEGISEIKIKEDGNYLSIYFAGPIRAAGGTTQAYVVLLADHIRKRLGLNKWVATKEEVARYVEEIRLYNRLVNLQYPSTQEELEWVVSHVPIEVNGDPTNQEEVSAHRNLPRIETNCVRGGACLVINDGVLAKSKKILKLISEIGIEGWEWLAHIPKEKDTSGNDKPGGKKGDGSGVEGKPGKEGENAPTPGMAGDNDRDSKFGDDLFQSQAKEEHDKHEDEKIPPKTKFIAEVIAGRPIFAHPSAHGGFRIRYGRSRNMGLAGYGFHPATMVLTDDFIAVGTQLRVERPGKSTVAMPVDSIEGPVVRLKNGDVIRVETTKQAREIRSRIDQILFLGDVLVGFGEFLENNHKLVPSPYCEEWWRLELLRYMEENALEVKDIEIKAGLERGTLQAILDDVFYVKPDATTAVAIARATGLPLHPKYIYLWNGIEPADADRLRTWLIEKGTMTEGKGGVRSLECKLDPEIKRLLDRICVPHAIKGGSINFLDESPAIIATLLLDRPDVPFPSGPGVATTVDALNLLGGIRLRNKARYFMGTRMGRPEKAKERKMSPPVHVLFPLGHEASAQRVFQDSMAGKTVTVEIANRYCPRCKIKTFKSLCHKCKSPTLFYRTCPKCKKTLRENIEECPDCGVGTKLFSPQKVDLVAEFNRALEVVRCQVPKIKGVKGMSSEFKIPEPLEKGMLRAKHDTYVYKDGTMRFDTGDCPLTHFTPEEIHVKVEKLVELGYTRDIHGKPLTSPKQVLELKVQDILLPVAALDYFRREAAFIDELLEKVYGLEPFYNIKKPADFIGHLVVGLAPHTSAGVVGRIIGFTKAHVGYAHTTYHAAKRRNCDGDEDGILLFLDVLLNFSRYYLPSRIGAKMDTPLVISNRVVPEEVDSEAHNVDTMWEYPLEFYEKTLEYPDPKSLKDMIETLGKRLGTEGQYEGIGFTHPTSNINEGPKVTAYKELESMDDKIEAQFALAKKIAAVDQVDQARRVISAHFTPDIMGNLRSFATQSFRCTKCNSKYRRPPIKGACTKCGNPNLTLTVSAGSIKKYLEKTLKMCKDYNLSDYTQEKIKILSEKVEETIFNGQRKQKSLAMFF